MHSGSIKDDVCEERPIAKFTSRSTNKCTSKEMLVLSSGRLSISYEDPKLQVEAYGDKQEAGKASKEAGKPTTEAAGKWISPRRPQVYNADVSTQRTFDGEIINLKS